MADNGHSIIANIDRFNEFMGRNQLAAVVVRSGQNVTYLSGIAYPGTLARLLEFPDAARGVLLLWPHLGQPIVVLDKTAERLTLRDSWVKRVETYDAYTESPYSRLCKMIKDERLDRERIGFEENYVSAAHWKEIQNLLPHLQMVDCVPMMDEVRWIKTPGEIALLKKGADILDDAYLEVFPTVRPGDTEREVHSRMVASCIRRGANWAHGMLHSSTNLIPYAGESDTVFKTGDVIRTDYVAYVQGYPGHQSRSAVLGKPSAELQHEYNTYRDIYRMTIDQCRPGVRAGDVYQFVVDEFQKQGWKHKEGGYGALVGHGVGAWWHQQEPILRQGSDIFLEEGMVLAIEPFARKWWHLQDMVIVRKSGPELISEKMSTDQMYVIE